MTSPQICLGPASGDDRGSFLRTLELVACGRLQLAQVVGAVVGHRVPLEPGPQVLHWIEVGGVGREEGNLNVPIQTVEVVAHEVAVMRSCSVPDHQQGLPEMGFERLEEFDQLFLLDAALVQPEQAVGARQTGDDR